MIVIRCYLETEDYKVLKSRANNFHYFEVSTSLSFKRCPPISAVL